MYEKNSVTVVIPTANRGAFLEESLNSVLAQSTLPRHILIIDNGSDRCFKNRILPDVVKIIRTAPNIGASRARNIGLKKTKTEFVAFLDDDDIWDKDFLKNALKSISNREFDVIVGALYRKKDRLSVESVLYKQFPTELYNQRKVYYSNPGFGGQNFLGKTDFLIRIGGFNENMTGSEDRDIAARVLESGGVIGVAPNSIAILCDHQGFRNRANRSIRSRLQFISNHKNYMTNREKLFAYVKLLDHIQKIARRKLSHVKYQISAE